MADQHGESYYESSTMSKRDYYTLRDKGVPLNQGLGQQQQLAERQQEAADKPVGKGQKKYFVIMLDGSTVPFVVNMNASPQDLFESVCTFAGLHEKEYFGLCYRDEAYSYCWLNNDKKLDKQLSKSEDKLELMVKFYPPDPENLREHLTRYFLMLQIRQNMITDMLPCSDTTYIVLGSYVVQSELGDFEGEKMSDTRYLLECPFCPERERKQELLDLVQDLHRSHRGMLPEEADVHFLSNAKKLAMYGVDLHQVRDTHNEDTFVGVYHGGVVMYRNSIRINRFSWPKILKVSYKGNALRLSIRTADSDSNHQKEVAAIETIVEVKSPNKKLAKKLWRAVVEHHGFFRLKSPEKPKKPLIPGTFNRKWNYTGPTAQQINDQPLHEYPEVAVTQGMRKSFRKKDTASRDYEDGFIAAPTKATEEDAFNDDAFNREQQLNQQQQQQQQLQDDGTTAGPNAGRIRQPPDLLHHRPGHWEMCPADADPLLAAGLSPDTSSGRCPPEAGENWQGVRANKGVVAAGKWYYETKVAGDAGAGPVPARVGWSAAGASLQLGEDQEGFGFGQDPSGQQAQKYSAGLPQQYGVELMSGDIVGAFVDLDEGSVEFAVNGERLGPAFDLPAQLQQRPLFPAAASQGGVDLDWNFGDDPQRPLAYPPGGAWMPIGQASDPADNPRAWHLNPRDVSGPGLVISPDLCAAQAVEGWQGVRADRGLQGASGGKFYYEVEPLEDGGLGRVGWTSESGSLDVGRDADGWGYGADYEGFGLGGSQGKRLHADEIDTYGEPFGQGDVIGCLIDLDYGSLQFSKNGRHFGEAYRLPASCLQGKNFFPTVCMKDQTLDVNLGQRPFRHQPSAEWMPVCLAPDHKIKFSRTAAQNTELPSVDQKYDQIKDSRPRITPRGNQDPAFNSRPNISVHESRTERDEVGEPETEIVTYTDEFGNIITKKQVTQKRKKQVITSKVVEARGYGPGSTEHLESALNGGDRPTARRNRKLSETDEGDDLLNDIIYQQTGLSHEDQVVDENVSDFNMSTIDTRRRAMESDI